MSQLQEYFSGSLAEAIGWTLLHSLWQVSVIGVIVLVIRRFSRSASFRYQLGIVSLLAVLLVSAITFLVKYQPAGTLIGRELTGEGINLVLSEANNNAVNESKIQGDFLKASLPWMTLSWIIGVFVFAARLIGGLFIVNRLKRIDNRPFPAEWKNRLEELLQHAGIQRKVKILLSNRISVPMVAGILKPVILVPAGIITLLPVDQLESILFHEMAHIKRYDFLVNILQTIVEAVFFFHPVVWLISSMIRQERENCCDDFAVSLSGNRPAYAKALAGLGEFQAGANITAVAFSGNKNRVLDRVTRLLNPTKMNNNASEKVIAGGIILALAIILIISTGAGPTMKFSLNSLEKPAEPAQVDRETTPTEPAPVSVAEIPALTAPEEVPEVIVAPSEPYEPSGQLHHAVMDTLRHKRHSRMEIKDNTVSRDYVMKDGSERELKFVIREGEVKKLYVDGKEIPKSEFKDYRKEIDVTMKDLKQLDLDLREARKDLEEIDFEEIQREIQQEMQYFQQHEMPKLQEEMKQLQQEQLELQLNNQHMQQEMQEELQKAMEEFQLEQEEMQKELEEARQEFLEQMEKTEDGKYAMSEEEIIEMEKAMEEARKSMEHINQAEIMAQMEKGMKAMEEIDFKQMQKDIEMAMKDIDFEKIERELQENMKNLEMENYNIDKEMKSLEETLKELEKLELKEEK